MSCEALSTLMGNEATRKTLCHALQTGSLPHAILLTAPNGCGRNHWARCLAADYLFPLGGEGASAVLRGDSPEVLTAQGEGLSGQIKIERIREIRMDIYRTGLSSVGRVVIIRDAEHMMAPAANALLKVLEEPPKDVLFVLTARDASSLLQTIRSRCALYSLAEIAQEDMEKFLQAQGASQEYARLLYLIYGGCPGLGLHVLQSDDRKQTLTQAQNAATTAAGADLYTLLCLFSAFDGRKDGDKERRFDFLFDFSKVLAAAFHVPLAKEQGGVSALHATRFLPHVQNALTDLHANVAPKLVFGHLAIKLIEETI